MNFLTHIFFDFDSTLVSIETLDTLINKNMSLNSTTCVNVEKITAQGMNGELSLKESLSLRLEGVKIHKDDITSFALVLPEFITENMVEVIEKLKQNGFTPHIISGGFADYMEQTANELGIEGKNIHANSFTFDKNGFVTGFDVKNPLCENLGKAKVIQNLNLKNVIMVGDGKTDLEVFTENACDTFIGFGVHAKRDIVKNNSPHFVETMTAFETTLKKLNILK